MNRESSRSYKVPLKECRNYCIDHQSFILNLRVEWPERGGDEPNLVIDIFDKKTNLYLEQGNHITVQANSSIYHHENPVLSCKGQHYQYSPPANNIITTPTSNHNEVTLQSTFICNSGPSAQLLPAPKQNPAAPNDRSHSSAHMPFGALQTIQLSPLEPAHPSSLHTAQPPSIYPSERLNFQTSTINTSQTTQQLVFMQKDGIESKTGTSIYYPIGAGVMSSPTSIICECSDPIKNHEQNCPVVTLTSSPSSRNIAKTRLQTSPYDPTVFHGHLLSPHSNISHHILKNSLTDPITTSGSLAHTNPNHNLNSPSNATTFISKQQRSIITQMDVTASEMLSMSSQNILQQTSVSRPVIKSQSNRQTNIMSTPVDKRRLPEIGYMDIFQSHNEKGMARKDNDQISVPKQNKTQSQNIQPTDRNSSMETQTNDFSFILNIPLDHDDPFIFDNTEKLVTTDTTENNEAVLTSGARDHAETTPTTSVTNSAVRSPVSFDFSIQPITYNVKSIDHVVEEAIDGVIKGEGTVSVDDKLLSNSRKPKTRIALTNEVIPVNGTLHIESTESMLVDSSLSKPFQQNNSVILTHHVVLPPTKAMNSANTSIPHSSKNVKKRNTAKSSNSKKTKSLCNPSSNLVCSTSMSTCYQDLPQTSSNLNTSAIAASSNLSNEPTSYTDLLPPTSTVFDCQETVINPALKNIFSQSPFHSFDMENHDAEHFFTQNGHEQIPYVTNHDLASTLSSSPHGFIHSTTPPPTIAPRMTQILTPASTGKPVFISSNSDAIYDEFLQNPSFLTPKNHIDEQNVKSDLTRSSNIHNEPLETPDSLQTHKHINDSNTNSQIRKPEDSNENTKVTSNMKTNNQNINHENMNNNDENNKNKKLRKPSKIKRKTTLTNKNNMKNRKSKPYTINSKCTGYGTKVTTGTSTSEITYETCSTYEYQSCKKQPIHLNMPDIEQQSCPPNIVSNPFKKVECQFCHKLFNARKDYLTHLKSDHA